MQSLAIQSSNITQIARIENVFIFNACYQLSAREQKIVLFLISQIDSRDSEFNRQTVSIRQIESVLKADAKKYGGLYAELKDFQKRIRNKGIEFPTDIEVQGKKLDGYISWFQSVRPVKDKGGNISIEFLFSEPLKPFLLNLNEYVRISIKDVLKMRSGFSIRLFQVLRAHRDKMAKHQKKSELKLSIDELKRLLGLEGKYEDFRNFKRKVLQVAKKEINNGSSVKMDFQTIKEGRRVVGVKFTFTDARNTKSKPDENLVESLNRSRLFAYEYLLEYGIEGGIILNKILPKVQSSEFMGFEDWYFKIAIEIFESKSNAKTKQAKAGTFVKWFLDTFDEDQFANILEIINDKKKKLQLDDPVAFENRIKAKDMTNDEFKEDFKKSIQKV